MRMHGATETADDLPEWTSDLIEAGIAVLSFSARRHGEREAGAGAYHAWLREDPANRYLQTLIGTALDIVQAVEWLRSQDAIDAGRIGLWGGSFGGGCCLAATRYVRPLAVSSICALADYERVLSTKPVGLIRPEDFQRLTAETTALIREFDPALHAAEIPPTALLMVHGDRDTVIPPDGQRALYEQVAPSYSDMPERLAFLRHHGGHPTPEWCERTAVWWLRDQLRSPHRAGKDE